jgi:uncharacterized protein YndB with AHSA1/START domain
MTDPAMASLLEADGQVGLRFVRHLDHPPEKVWRAITESEHLQHWLPCDIVGERAEGAAIQLPFWADHVERYGIPTPVLDGEILVWDPPRTFEWMWSTDRLRFELEPDGDGTTLTFTTWLSGAGAGTTKQAAGYHLCLDQLAELLDTGAVATALVDLPPDDLAERYQAVVD